MAKIVLSENAPDGEVTFSLGGAPAFDLEGDGSYETDNREALRNAEDNPWLEVEYPEGDTPETAFRPQGLAPEDDVLSAENSKAFDFDTDEDTEPVDDNTGVTQSEVVQPTSTRRDFTTFDETDKD